MAELEMKTARTDKGTFARKHGMYGTRLYSIWRGIKSRCLNPNEPGYRLYGGRGITVCPEWLDGETFFKWALSHGYEDNLTIDRIDCNKGYSPDNCRWITNDEQQRNRRNNIVIEYNGEKHCLAEWARITGLGEWVIKKRLANGWSIEEALHDAKGSHIANARPCIGTWPDGTERWFECIGRAGREVGVHYTSIVRVCRGELNHAGHIKWRYADGEKEKGGS